MSPTYPNNTNKFMHQVCRFAFILGSLSFWHKDLGLPKKFTKYYPFYMITCGFIMVIVQISTLASFWYDIELSEKQTSDRIVFTFAHFEFSIVLAWSLCYRNTIREIHGLLSEEFLSKYLDKELEAKFLSKLKINVVVFTVASLGIVPTYGIEAMKYAIESGTGFAFPITHWPSLHDHSVIANLGRFIIFLSWTMYMCQITGTHMMVIQTTICMSFQFQNLQSYFRSLNGIFDESMGQDEKNEKYVRGFLEGIKLHVKIIGCTEDVQKVNNAMYSGQVIQNTFVISLLLVQFVSLERNLVNILTVGSSSFICLFVTGIFMCNAGDITLEASSIAEAMYDSGWQNVRGRAATKNVAALLTVAIARAQTPLDMTSLYIIKMSYESYVSLVRAAYSIFSVLIG